MKPKVEVILQSMKCAGIWQWRFKIIIAFYGKQINSQNTNRMKQNRTLRKTKPRYANVCFIQNIRVQFTVNDFSP